jgi:DNA polymerase III subunit epsilon
MLIFVLVLIAAVVIVLRAVAARARKAPANTPAPTELSSQSQSTCASVSSSPTAAKAKYKPSRETASAGPDFIAAIHDHSIVRPLLPPQFIVVDIETTGLSATTDEIIEIACVKVTLGQDRHEHFQVLIQPVGRISPRITALTGITQAMVDADGIELRDALAAFREFVGDLPLVAYNAAFDIRFLGAAIQRCGMGTLTNRYDCALQRTRKAVKGLPSYKLPHISKLMNLPDGDQHRALGDARRTVDVYLMAVSGVGSPVHWQEPVFELS